MKLLWKLLRQHVSMGQFSGFIFANLIGMIIVLTGFQFYNDVLPVFSADDSFMKANYIMVSKKIGTGNTISGRSTTFSNQEVEELKGEGFVKKVGAFTSTNYKVNAQMGVNGQQVMNSELFFESVPDDFVDIDMKDWQYKMGSDEVPVIMPRMYINMYNFGYAHSHSMPQISEGLMGMIDLNILIRGNGKEHNYRGKVVAFSSSISTMLVPQSFMDWSNNEYAPQEGITPTRLLMEVSNPADEKITQFLEDHGYEIETDKLDAEKTTYFLRMIVSLVMLIGLLISALSFYILMLSIYLLVQKNTKKLQNLLLIGYPEGRVALPYQLLTVGLNIAVLIIAIIVVFFVRGYYMNIITGLYPEIESASMSYTFMLGGALFVVVTVLNTLIIRNKIHKI